MPTLEYGIFRNTNNISLNSSKKQNWLQKKKHLLEMKIVLVRLNTMPKEGMDLTINYSTIRLRPHEFYDRRKICFVQLCVCKNLPVRARMQASDDPTFLTVCMNLSWRFAQRFKTFFRQKRFSNPQQRAKTFMDAKDCSSRNADEQPNPEHLDITPEL